MAKMKSLQPHLYDNRALKPGDEFECSPEHVQLLIALGRAEVVDEPSAGEYRTRHFPKAPRRKRAVPT